MSTNKKIKKPSVCRFPEEQMASITEPYLNDEGKYSTRLISKGMLRERFEKEFPPTKLSIAKAKKRNEPIPTFNMLKMCRSLLVEEYEKIGKSRERGNVRHFFYTNVIHTLTRIMGVTNIDSLNSTLNTAWKQLIKSGMITYEGMNVTSGKSDWLRTFAHHSTNYNLIICVEKQSLLDSLSWTAELFRASIITAAGQPSRAAVREWIRNLFIWGADLRKPFKLLVITDLDPAGDYIESSFFNQIESALQYYNDKEDIEEDKVWVEKPVRLFLKLNQLTDGFVQDYAVPAKDKKAKTPQAKKASRTKIKRFKERLELQGDDWRRLEIDGKMMKIELDAIKDWQMDQTIVKELLQAIDDHSLILIPEIMDETEKQREEVIKDFLEIYIEEIVEPVILEFLKPIKEALKEIENEINAENYKARDEYRTVEREVRNTQLLILSEYRQLQDVIIDKYNKKADKLVKDELQEIEEIEEEIEELKEQIAELEEKKDKKEEEIEEEIGFFREEISEIKANLEQTNTKLYDKRKLFLDPAEKIKSQIIEILDAQWELYQEEMKAFESQQRGKFGSYIRSLEKQMQDSLNSERVPIYFPDVESDPNVSKQLAYLLTHPKLLLEEGKSCLTHPKPVFQEANLLINAVDSDNFEDTKRNPDISKFRNAFSDPLIESLKDLMKKKLEVEPVTLDALIDIPDEYIQELSDFVELIKKTVPKEVITKEKSKSEDK